MTSRTHDLAAFTAVNLTIAYFALPQMNLATLIVAITGNMLGGLMPDIDDATSEFWQKIRGGTFIGDLLHPLIGHHRMISHSLLGMALAGGIVNFILNQSKPYLIVDMNIVWWSTIIGYFSHLIMDSITVEGIPWFFPIPIRFGFPPFKFLRIKTGSWVEKFIVFPGLLILNGYLFYSNYPRYLSFLAHIIG